MIRTRIMKYFVLLFSFLFFLSFSTISNGKDSSSSEERNDTVVYLKNNIHAQQGPKDVKASYSNWTDPGAGHIFIPVNTPITIGKFKRGFTINNQKDGMVVFMEFNQAYMQMGVDESLELITSPTQVSLEGFSTEDIKGISDGKAYEGMTKEGVRIALGYPAKHRTLSLEENTWIYWTNRFKTIAVEFDDTGKVIQIGQ